MREQQDAVMAEKEGGAAVCSKCSRARRRVAAVCSRAWRCTAGKKGGSMRVQYGRGRGRNRVQHGAAGQEGERSIRVQQINEGEQHAAAWQEEG